MPKNCAVNLLLFLMTCVVANAQEKNIFLVSDKRTANSFQIFAPGFAASLHIDENDAKVVSIAATAFIGDIELLSGKKMKLLNAISSSHTIITGTIGSSKWIDDLIKSKQLDVAALKGRWECFVIKIISPTKLVIAGSDPRGTAFGLFHLSKLFGVSPFVWWADVVPEKKQRLFVSGSYTSKEPSVKYRGIFLNDEDWGLQPWAAKTFEPETGDIGPKTYAKIFELLLRLRANLIWPAMHDCTKAFFRIPGNSKVAEDYAILIGTSHAEPMLRNNVGEWDEKTMGHFNYISNKETVYRYWEDRVRESKNINAIYSLGMRGVHDSKMEGVKDAKEAVPLLEGIFRDQRHLLTQYINKDTTAIPQVFTAYKEVLEIYDNGLRLPDDVTLVWPDDNYGYIQRLNNENEKQRTGGSGVYYHASYWGRPHDYLWLASTHPALMQKEMMKAFNNGSNRLWVLNVGDIKPLEYLTQMFLDMAYDADPFKDNHYAKDHMLQWLSYNFGKGSASAMHNMLWEYYNLAFERRPEFMGWSQTEPTTKTNFTQFNHFFYGDEAQKRIDRYQELEQQAKAIRLQIAAKDQNAYYQLVYYPVVASSLMNKKFVYRDKAYFYAKQNRLSAADYAQLSKDVYDSIVAETNYFNNQLSGGKWKHIMSMAPRKLPVFQPVDSMSRQHVNTASDGWSVAPEGFITKDSSLTKAKKLQLPRFDALNRQQYFIDVFLMDKKAVSWKASTSAPWIKLSVSNGKLLPEYNHSQVRILVTVDWQKAPLDNEFTGIITIAAEGEQISVEVSAARLALSPQSNTNGFVENNGYVAMNAVNYQRNSKRSSGRWVLLPGLSYAGNALESQTVLAKDTAHLKDTTWIKANSSFVEYDFTTFSEANTTLSVFGVPTHPLNNTLSMRYAVVVDNGPLQLVDFKTFGRSEEWKQSVLRNRAEKKIALSFLPKGTHTLRVYCVDPGVMLDAMLIDIGGLKNANGLIPETRVVK